MQAPAIKSPADQSGFTLVEVIVTLVVTGLMLASFGIATSNVLGAREHARQKEALAQDAALALHRMVTAVKDTAWLTLPLADDPSSPQIESLREQRVPPDAGRETESAVLAVRLGATVDRDANNVPDADNDADGRIDEDPGADTSFDFAPGLIGLDDDGDGWVDEGIFSDSDDDEDGGTDEDPQNRADDDADGSVDEDLPGDISGDFAPGLAGVDDDGDGAVDEGSFFDDDEDGVSDEDWYDIVAFYLDGNELIERQSFPYDLTENGFVSGRDFLETVIADDVSYFRVERVRRPGARATLVDITLELSKPGGASVSLNTRVRVGGSS